MPSRPSFLPLCLTATLAAHPSAVLLAPRVLPPSARSGLFFLFSRYFLSFSLSLYLSQPSVHPRHYRVFTVFCPLQTRYSPQPRKKRRQFCSADARKRNVGAFATYAPEERDFTTSDPATAAAAARLSLLSVSSVIFGIIIKCDGFSNIQTRDSYVLTRSQKYDPAREIFQRVTLRFHGGFNRGVVSRIIVRGRGFLIRHIVFLIRCDVS